MSYRQNGLTQLYHFTFQSASPPTVAILEVFCVRQEPTYLHIRQPLEYYLSRGRSA